MNAYQSASILDALVKEVSFSRKRGNYYLHVLVVDNFGSSQELVSQTLHTECLPELCFGYTGSVHPVELEHGNYKFEAMGGQGGGSNSIRKEEMAVVLVEPMDVLHFHLLTLEQEPHKVKVVGILILILVEKSAKDQVVEIIETDIMKAVVGAVDCMAGKWWKHGIWRWQLWLHKYVKTA